VRDIGDRFVALKRLMVIGLRGISRGEVYMRRGDVYRVEEAELKKLAEPAANSQRISRSLT
jgi:hypothetical protein